jgi:hypothetical protein
MQCVVMTAHFLERCRYRAFTWEAQALRRATNWLYDENGTIDTAIGDYSGFPPEEACDPGANCPFGATCISASNTPCETWVPWITDEYYSDTRRLYPPGHPMQGMEISPGGAPGKVFGFAAWWSSGI